MASLLDQLLQEIRQEFSPRQAALLDRIVEGLREEFGRPQKPLLRRSEATELLGISLTTLDEWVKAGKLERIEVGGTPYITQRSIVGLLDPAEAKCSPKIEAAAQAAIDRTKAREERKRRSAA